MYTLGTCLLKATRFCILPLRCPLFLLFASVASVSGRWLLSQHVNK
jgi:hypothetical protein